MSLPKEETPLFHSRIYPPASLGFSSLAALAVHLQSFIEEQCRDELQGYIWQREAPRVNVISAQAHDSAHLEVSMRHGGNIEDEWLLVHLLILASIDKRFSEIRLLETLEGTKADEKLENGGLIIDVRDEDGQFLLIEGADHLPEWVQPGNADGRLWIYKGHFHLISPEIHLGDTKSDISATQLELFSVHPLTSDTALALVRSFAGETRAPASFEEAVLRQRMPSYPLLSWALMAQHNTLVYVSPKAARALHRYPQILANAAEAFDGREGPKDSRCLREMKVFGPMAEEPLVGASAPKVLLVKVKLPRRLYATLLSQRYLPSKAFGQEWRSAVSAYWESLEKASRGANFTADEEAQRDEGRRYDLGCKVMCGLELVYTNVKERLKNKPSELFTNSKDSDVRQTSSYLPFIASLTRMGFFGDEIPDSKGWKVKEKQAVDLLLQSKTDSSELEDEHISDNLQHFVNVVSQKEDASPLPPHLPATLPHQALRLEEDPDDFLYEAPGQSNDKGDDKVGAEEGETEEEKAAMDQVNAFANKLQGFVEGRGDEVGALFEDEDVDSGDSEAEGMDVDQKRDFEDMTSEEKVEAMKGLIPGLPSEEWGAKRDKAALQDTKEDMSVDEDIEEMEGAKTGGATGFSRRVQYDGASDSEESVDDEILRAGDTEEDRRSRAKWLDIEREVEEDERNRKAGKEDLDAFDMADGEEGDDVQLGQDEIMSFIEFTRKELGLSTEQYEDILRKRRERGAFVPGEGKQDTSTTHTFAGKKGNNVEEVIEMPTVSDEDLLKGLEHKSARQFQAERREEHGRALRNQRTTAEEKKIARDKAQRTVQEVEAGTVQRSSSNIRVQEEQSAAEVVDPFEKLMRAMDEELAKHQGQKIDAPSSNSQRAPMSIDEKEEEDEDEIMSQEDAELLEKMLHNGPPASLRALMEKESKSGQIEGDGLSSIEQEVMQSMLASYQAQLGGAGPVGALAGRLGIGSLPRNSD